MQKDEKSEASLPKVLSNEVQFKLMSCYSCIPEGSPLVATQSDCRLINAVQMQISLQNRCQSSFSFMSR